MTVLFLTSSFPKNKCDTSGVFIKELALALVPQGMRVIVLAPHFKGGQFYEVRDGVHVYRFPYFFPFGLQRLAYGAGIMNNLKESFSLIALVPFFIVAQLTAALWIVRREKVDFVHAHWSIPQGVIGICLKFLLKKKCITTIHGSDVLAMNGGLANRLNRVVFSCSDCVTANSSATADAVKLLCPETRLSRLPMGVNVHSFFVKGRYIPDSKVKRLLFVGRLIELKGVGYLIKALKILCRVYPYTQLTVVGDGPQRALLERLTLELQLDRHVRFVGNVPHKDVATFIQGSDVFVLPSIVGKGGETEGLGVVILEAMACGVPVVGSRVGGIPDLITDGITGLLTEPESPQDLAKCILRLFDDDELALQLSEKAHRNVKDNYCWDSIALRCHGLYESLR